ncbi:MAG: hypothetical protein QNJ46_22920 [Leptolyngbyaceae cyanobacterium MO_188.B28]|nr:hypothetical protein [Leptolyngbyaceae cyanobacterium MO_188.B28]
MLSPMLLAELYASNDALKSEVKIDTFKAIVEIKNPTQDQVISITSSTSVSPDSDSPQPEFTSRAVEFPTALIEQPDSLHNRLIQLEPQAVKSPDVAIAQRQEPDLNHDRLISLDFKLPESSGVPIAQLQQPNPNRDRIIQPDTDSPSPLPRTPPCSPSTT